MVLQLDRGNGLNHHRGLIKIGPDGEVFDDGRGGSGFRGGGAIKLPGKANIVPFKRMPKLPSLPKMGKLPIPKMPQIPKLPPFKWNLPGGVIPSFSKEEEKKVPKDFKNEETKQPSYTPPENPYETIPEKIENTTEQDKRKAMNDIAKQIKNNSDSKTELDLPKGTYEITFQLHYVASYITVWWKEKKVAKGNFNGSFEDDNPTYSVKVKNPESIHRHVNIFNSYTDSWGYSQIHSMTGISLIYDGGKTLSLIGLSGFMTFNPVDFQNEGDVFGTTSYTNYTTKNISVVNLKFSKLDLKRPTPWKNRNPINKEKDDMSCEKCQAAAVIRALQRTVTVDVTPIVPTPLGLVVSPMPTKQIKRVFALPGTEFAIADQFNLFDEIKKRLAKTFNQSRMTKVLQKLQQVMSVTQFVLDIHTALMLSEDIVQTFFQPLTGAVDTIAKVLDEAPFVGELFDLEEKGLDSGAILSAKFEEAMKTIFGVQAWSDVKAKWASFNNIVRGAAMQIHAVRDLHDSQKQLSEMTASKMGKLHNKLVKSGAIFDSALWNEDVKARSVWLEKFYQLENLADDNPITNSAQYVQSWGSQVLDIKEQKKELAESKEKYNKALADDLKVLTEGKAETNAVSQGADIARADATAPQTDNVQAD